jgi:CRP-like cAMP-binding protein
MTDTPRSDPNVFNALVGKILNMTPILAGMVPTDAQKLFELSRKVSWKADDLVFSFKDVATEMYILVGGNVIVWLDEIGKERPIAKLGPGDSFGEMALVVGGRRGANITAVSPAFAIAFNPRELQSQSSLAIVIYKNIAKSLAERLTNSNQYLASLHHNEAPAD